MPKSKKVLPVLILAFGCQSPGYGVEAMKGDGWDAPSPFTPALPASARELAPRARRAPARPDPVPTVGLPPPSSASAAASGAPAGTRGEAPCPPEMVLAEGLYCPRVLQRCKEWMDEGSEFLPQHRCLHFERPSKCLADRERKRFCIDRDEYTEPGERLPANFQSWMMASKVCRSLGKRICFESEWVFACEGEEMRPYPYGYDRDATLCNFDLTDLMDEKGKLKDLRKPSAELSRCTSPFGARNMVGNVDEWAFREGGMLTPFRSALKGGWWMAARNRCRPATTAHDEYYNDTQTGFRCCRDAR